MQQLDLFDVTLEKKINRMEKWVSRIQKEIWFLKQVYDLSQKNHRPEKQKKEAETLDMFAI